MPGANLRSKGRLHLKGLLWKYMIQVASGNRNRNKLGRRNISKFPTMLGKAGVPASNTAADAPDRAGQICIDTVNKDAYLSTAYTNPTTHTWTKISD